MCTGKSVGYYAEKFGRILMAGALLAGGAVLAPAQDTSNTKPDNTNVNKRDRAEGEPTADQQKNNKSDRETAKQIRKALMNDKSLSTYAHNVKVIVQNGTVTLKGPVRSDEEKKTVEAKAVFGIYRGRQHAEEAVDALRLAGFRNSDVSVLLQDNVGTKDFAHEKSTKAPEGTTTGGIAGGALGGALGWLAGIGALAIPGLGPFIAAGPIMGALAGVGVGGAVGGLIGALTGMGIPEYEAKRYEGRVKDGGVLLSVHCDSSDWVKRAKNVLKETGADDISSTGEASADYAESDKPLPRTRSSGGGYQE